MSRKRSNIWLHFSILSDKENKAKCDLCGTILSIFGGNVSNLNRHLKSKHPTVNLNKKNDCAQQAERRDESPEYDDFLPVPQLQVTPSTSAVLIGKQFETIPDIRQYTISKKPLPITTVKKLNLQLLKFIISEYHPFKIVEEAEFQKFIKDLNPKYELPSRKTLSTTLLSELYNKCLEKIQERINKAEAIALTTDSWTSLNNESFIAVTAHYIINENDEKFKLENILLECRKLDERHTADNIASYLKDMTNRWNISNKIAAIVSDNAAVMLAAIRLCSFRHVPCFAHTLNLIVQHALEDIDLKITISKVKDTVEYFRRSSYAAAKLKGTIKQMNIAELKLINDVVTRWNSTLEMLRRFLRMKDAIVATCAVLRSETADINKLLSHTFESKDWHLMEELIEILKIFEEVTNEISGEQYITSSKVVVFAKIIMFKLQSFSNCSTKYSNEIQNMVKKIQIDCNQHFLKLEENEVLSHSTILDPRFKKIGFCNEVRFNTAADNLKKKVVSILRQNVSANESQVEEETEIETPSLWEEFEAEARFLTARAEPTAAGHVEVDKYLNEPLIKRTEDPLKYWSDRKYIYPGLVTLMKRRLCVPGSSVPCERIFSKTGALITTKRNRLTGSRVEKIVFLKQNSKFLNK